MPTPLQDLRERIVERWSARPLGGYLHLPNIGGIECAGDSFDVGASMTVRRATIEEVSEIRLAIDAYVAERHRNPYESELTRTEQSGGNTSYHYEPLPPERFRYVVLEHGTLPVPMHDLLTASYATMVPLDAGLMVSNVAGAVGYGCRTGLARAFEPMESSERLVTLTESALVDLKETFGRFLNHPEEVVPAKQFLGRVSQLTDLPARTPLRYLGLFSVLEGLLAHKPRASDPYESITRQVQKKMALLNRRFKNPMVYDAYFSAAKVETVWSKLYELRSRIAHGATSLVDDELRVLVSLEAATAFLTRAVSSVLAQALIEPQLLADLREC